MKKFFLFAAAILLGLFSYISNTDEVEYNTQLHSTGATGGYLVNKPFDLSVRQSSYISSTGYLYSAGYNNKYEFGNGSSAIVSTHFRLYKDGDTNDVFKDPLSWGFSWYHSIIVDNDGSVWTAGTNNEYRLGLGLSSTSATEKYFVKVPTIGTDEYKAVSTSPGYFHSVVLLDDDTIWCAGSGKYFGMSGSYSSYTQITLPDVNAKILDYSGSYTSTYVLYDNGELYRLSGTTSTWYLVGENIKFFDADGSANYVYAVTYDNEILFKKESTNDDLVEVKDTIIGEVVQVRGAGIDSGSTWGYLNKAGDLYIADEQSDGQGDLTRINESNIRFFDMGSSYDASVTTYGYINQYAQMYLWGSNTQGQLATGSTSSGLDDPNHSESSLVIPSLDADFTGLYSVDPIIRKVSDNSIIDPDSLYLNFNEGTIYVDYSNYEFDSNINQKIEVSITDTYGVICTFTLDKSNKVNQTASYPTAPGVYTITSQLFSYVDNEWVLSGSPNCTIFELGIPKSDMKIDEDIFLEEMKLVAYNNNVSTFEMYSSIINQAYVVFEKGITFTNDFYYYDDGIIKTYDVTKDDISVRLLRKTSSSTSYTALTSVTSFSTSYNYYVEFTFNGIDGFYDEQIIIMQLVIETRTVYSSTNARFTNEGDTNTATSLTFYNSGNRYYISLQSLDAFLDDKYSLEIEITGTNFYSRYVYGDENTWAYIPKSAGTYIVKVYLFEETGYSTIEYPAFSSRTLTISTSSAIKLSIEDTTDLSIAFSSIIAPSNGDASNDIKNAAIPYLDQIILGSTAYGVSNNEFSELVITNDILKYAFYYNNASVTSVSNPGSYSVRIYLNSSNYSTSTSSSYYITISFEIEGRMTISDDSIVFDNDTTEMIYYNGSKYSIKFIELDEIFDSSEYQITINITDEFGFSSSYDYKTVSDTWDYMPKLVGEYKVTVVLKDTTSTTYTSYSYTTLYIANDSNVSLNVSTDLTELFGTILTQDDNNLIDDILSVVLNEYLSINTNLYEVTRTNGIDTVNENVVVTTLSDYSFTFYNIDEVNVINQEGVYSVVISFNGVSGSYENLEALLTYSVIVEKRITLNNVEVGNKVGATAYFVDSDGRMVSVVNYNSEYNFIIDAIRDNTTYFDSSYTVEVKIYNDDNQYEFTYINPLISEISFDLLPKKSGDYNVEMSLYNSIDDYVSVRTTSLSINSQDINLVLNEELPLDLVATKDGLNNILDEFYFKRIDVYVYSLHTTTLTVVENNKFVDKEINDLIKLTYYILIDGEYVEVDSVVSSGTYKVEISIIDEFDSFSYQTITDEFIVNKDMSFILPVVISCISITVVLGLVIFVLKRKKQ